MKNSRVKTWILYVLLAVIILRYFLLWNSVALNIPISDDFPAFIDFYIKWASADSLSGKLSALSSQINEHKVFYDRAWFLLITSITGTVNFKLLSFIGNLALPGFLLLFGLKLKAAAKPLLLLIPIALLLFNPLGYDNMFCSMMSLQNFTFPLMCAVVFYVLSKAETPGTLLPAVITGIVATFTTGSAVFIWPVGIVSLLYQRKRKLTIYWSIATVAAWLLFLLTFIPTPAQEGAFLEPFSHPLLLIQAFFEFVGCLLPITPLSGKPEAFLGGIIFTILVILFIRNRKKLDPFWWSLLLFLLGTAALVAVGRFHLHESFASRFKINSTLILICTSVLLFEEFKKPVFRNALISGLVVFTLALNLFAYRSTNDFRFWVDSYNADLVNALNNQTETIFLPKKAYYLKADLENSAVQNIYSRLSEEENAIHLAVANRVIIDRKGAAGITGEKQGTNYIVRSGNFNETRVVLYVLSDGKKLHVTPARKQKDGNLSFSVDLAAVKLGQISSAGIFVMSDPDKAPEFISTGTSPL